jgi:transcriptional regulator with XRE-family HTH domain
VPRTPFEEQKEEAKQIGRRLKWVREQVCLTATELAADVGVDTSAIRHIEGGLRLPSIHLLMSLCHVLRISPQYLLWGTLEGVDPELAASLKSLHPTLNWPSAAPAPGNIHSPAPSKSGRPKTRTRLSA